MAGDAGATKLIERRIDIAARIRRFANRRAYFDLIRNCRPQGVWFWPRPCRLARCRSQVGSYLGTPDSRPPLQSEHEQHRLIAHLAKLRRVDEPGPGVAAEPRQDGEVLLAAGLEGHRRRVDAGADIDLP